MPIEFTRNGQKISLTDFENGILNDALDQITDQLADQAASVVDPLTGKHPPVFVRRVGERWYVQTEGSDAFARALESRLGLAFGEVRGMNESVGRRRHVYLAHATEDKGIAEPIARGLMQRGIDVWYDNWEIGYGDSLRRKMEEGLSECTHFVVLLTKNSIEKPWVKEEIDAGLILSVEGTSKFVGLRHGLAVEALSPLLKSKLSPPYTEGEEGVDELASQIFGLSKKPPLGERPNYVRKPAFRSSWSPAARSVAEYFVRSSQNASLMDPQVDYSKLQAETGLPLIDVRIGVLDLMNAGLLEKSNHIGGQGIIWPKSELFAEFDANFMDWNPADDAREIATYIFNSGKLDGFVSASQIASALNWSPRRFNPAATYLVSARILRGVEHLGGDAYAPSIFQVGDELLRFVRSL